MFILVRFKKTVIFYVDQHCGLNLDSQKEIEKTIFLQIRVKYLLRLGYGM